MSRDALRISARYRGELARELRDYFAHEPGAVVSNFGGIAALALSGVRTDGGNPNASDIAADRMLRITGAVRHHARVRKAFRALPEEHRRVLAHAFGARVQSSDVRKALEGQYGAAAALLTDAAREACKRAAGTTGEPTREQVATWLVRACVSQDEALARVAEERDELVEAALAAYSEHRGGRKRERYLTPEGYGL